MVSRGDLRRFIGGGPGSRASPRGVIRCCGASGGGRAYDASAGIIESAAEVVAEASSSGHLPHAR